MSVRVTNAVSSQSVSRFLFLSDQLCSAPEIDILPAAAEMELEVRAVSILALVIVLII